MKKIRKKTPRVAVLIETSLEIPRTFLVGILRYARIYGPWEIDVVKGAAKEQRVPDRKHWKGSGIIGRVPTRRVADDIVAAKLPTVVIDLTDEYLKPSHPLSRFHHLYCDGEGIGKTAADYFLNGPFEHFAFVGEVNGVNWSRYREESFCRRLAGFGRFCHIYPLPEKSKRDWALESNLMARWLKKLPKPLAVFAANDMRARNVITACQSVAIPVPYQVAVLGVNNEQLMCETMSPSLSSIAMDSETGGFEAARMLDLLMRGEKPESRSITFGATQVIARNSTESIHVAHPDVVKAMEFIRINAGTNIQVADVARHLGLTRQWAEKLFKNERGHSIKEEIQDVRMRTIRSLVTETTMPFQDIARRCGFECIHHLGDIFKKVHGVTMSEYRQRETKK